MLTTFSYNLIISYHILGHAYMCTCVHNDYMIYMHVYTKAIAIWLYSHVHRIFIPPTPNNYTSMKHLFAKITISSSSSSKRYTSCAHNLNAGQPSLSGSTPTSSINVTYSYSLPGPSNNSHVSSNFDDNKSIMFMDIIYRMETPQQVKTVYSI